MAWHSPWRAAVIRPWKRQNLNPRDPISPAPAVETPKLSQVELTNQFDRSWLAPATNLFTVGPGDKLEIELLSEPGSKTVTVVAPDGKIYFSLLPGIDVWGLSLGQIKARLEQELSKYVRDQPQVSLVLRDVQSRHVWILGHVQAPGIYPLAAPMTLLEALSLAGGSLSLSAFRQAEAFGASDELADLRRSFVLREGKMLPVDFQRLLHLGDLSQNIYLQPDDFIYLPATTAREIYVLGAVAQPRAVPFKDGMTVASAVGSAVRNRDGRLSATCGGCSRLVIAPADRDRRLQICAPRHVQRCRPGTR